MTLQSHRRREEVRLGYDCELALAPSHGTSEHVAREG